MSKCIFGNLKECFRQSTTEAGRAQDYTICTACLLSRIERTVFNLANPKDKNGQDRRPSTERTEDKDK